MNRPDLDFSAFEQAPQLPEIRRSAPANGWEIAHHHLELEFNLVVSGKAAYFLEDRHYDLAPGTLVWLLPHQRHRLLRAPGLDMWVGTFPPALCTPDILADAALHPIKRLSAEDAVALDALFSHVSQDADNPVVYQAGMLYALRSALYIARNSAGPPPPSRHPAVTQALGLLRTDDEIANLTDLARQCGVSASYLGELLLTQTGRGFVEWRNIARLDRFQSFYPASEDLLTAALAAGFGSYTQFHRVFQDMIGTTPGDWARRRSDTGPITLPRMSQSRDQLSPGSQRLIWYNLGAVRFAAAGQWLAALFRDGLAPVPDGAEPGGAIDSGCADMTVLLPLLPALADELATTLPDHADRIRAAFAENDIPRQFRQTLGLMGADHGDLTSLAMVALAAQSLVANWGLLPTADEMRPLLAFVRHRAAQPDTAVDPAQRLEIAAGLVAHALILRHAWIGASNSVDDAVATRLSNAAHVSALAMLGLDVRRTPLYGPRSPYNLSQSER